MTSDDLGHRGHDIRVLDGREEQKPDLRWEDMRIWKMDLKGAYTLLSFRPEDVGLFAMLLTGDLVYIRGHPQRFKS
jgi:hypothetical protein